MSGIRIARRKITVGRVDPRIADFEASVATACGVAHRAPQRADRTAAAGSEEIRSDHRGRTGRRPTLGKPAPFGVTAPALMESDPVSTLARDLLSSHAVTRATG